MSNFKVEIKPGTPWLRCKPDLAVAIGFNESILLLQIDYWVSISKHEYDGQLWTYQTLDDMKALFSFWSRGTIIRTLKKLREMGLIQVDQRKRYKYDQSKCYTVNYDQLREMGLFYLFQRKMHDAPQYNYAEYLQSDHWKETRKGALKRARFACQVCNSKHDLQVHHRTYQRLGKEAPADLIVLCDDCHGLFHENGKLVRDDK